MTIYTILGAWTRAEFHVRNIVKCRLQAALGTDLEERQHTVLWLEALQIFCAAEEMLLDQNLEQDEGE